MNVFILHNKVKTGSYADALFHLLILYFQKQDFTSLVYHEINEVRNTKISEQNTALILHTGKKKLSFFARLKLKNIVKQKGFTHFIQITDSKPIPTGLPQLIIPNEIRTFIARKPVPKTFFAICSKAEKRKLSDHNTIVDGIIKLISPAAEDSYQAVSWSEQQSLKMQYTQGREYFFALAEDKTIHSFTDLLKAFSTFKKWQQSSMKLVVAGTLSFTGTGEWKEKISTYKFREDVVLLNDINTKESIRVLAGAYAFIHTPFAENDVLPLLQSMQCYTPCLSFTTDSIEEYTSDSAILVEQNNYDLLAEKMILLYKDEALRSRLITKGKEVSQQYSKEATFAAFAEALSLPLH